MYKVRLRNNIEGVDAWICNEGQYDAAAAYWWNEGDFACDCNRHDFWCEALGIEPMDIPCGNSMYSIVEVIVDANL